MVNVFAESWAATLGKAWAFATAQRQSRQQSERQPRCHGARSFSEGAVFVESWPSTKTCFCRGFPPADGQMPGKGNNTVSVVVPTMVGRGALVPVGEGYRSLKSNRD
jgi:hypothetical protein